MQNAINHMNEHHTAEVLLLAKHFGKLNEASEAVLVSINEKTITINTNIKTVEIITPELITKENVKSILIGLTKEAAKHLKPEESTANSLLILEIHNFINSFKTAVLATLDEHNNPYATYSPFIQYNNKNYIYISEVAEHYSNLINNPNLEILFLEDEATAKLITARKRVRFKATAKLLGRDIEDFENIMDSLQAKLGNEIKTIRQMNDFNLFEITLKDGRYVKGFGKAFYLNHTTNGLTAKQITGADLGKDSRNPHNTNTSNNK
ncbi:pyridoxamine 5'-phosphate oxidase family protein [Rickettsiales bacterium LUAb2]